jgi:hypothetical protein
MPHSGNPADIRIAVGSPRQPTGRRAHPLLAVRNESYRRRKGNLFGPGLLAAVGVGAALWALLIFGAVQIFRSG